jgi:3-oxoacyl-[acyl-carrier protein] reductase
MLELEHKIAFVTGSSRGIGAGIAKAFAAHGAAVAIHGRDRDALAIVEREIAEGGGRSIAVTGDVTSFDDVERIREEIERQLGPVDVLVANAGGNYSKPGAFETLTAEEWHATVNGNLTATFYTLKSFLPGMKGRRRGNIITISSAAARRPHPGSPIAYAAAKAGIQLMTQDVAAQAGSFNVRVNCIAPETILTERTEQRIPDELKTQLIDTHPLKRLGTPEDVAAAAVFLASEASGWITGVIVDVAGGAVMNI